MSLPRDLVAPSTVTVSGTTLFDIAARVYGDATLWTRIAAANDRADPWVDEITVLVLPRPDGRPGTGGILGNV